VLSSVALSVAIGLAATVLGLPFAVGLGYWLARTRSPWRVVVSIAVFLPLVLPPVVTGWLLLALLGRNAPLGSLLSAVGLPVPFTPGAAVVAAVVVGMPLYVMSARAAFAAIDPRYEAVSASLGDPPLRTFRRVTLPLAAPGLLAGAILSFARALGEFGATIVLAGNTERTRTIAVAVYALLDAPQGDGQVQVLVLASVLVSALSLVGYELLVWLQRRHLELDDGR
jgi:molybdate transport system permease protein